MAKIKLLLAFFISAAILVSCNEVGTSQENASSSGTQNSSQTSILDAVLEQGKYTTKDSVAAYIHKFQKLPSNYVNKAEGQKMYEQKGNTFTNWNFNPLQVLGIMIGGDDFYNNEGLLPTANYKECDVDYFASNRGTKRLVYTNTGIVYYTANHYELFSKLY